MPEKTPFPGVENLTPGEPICKPKGNFPYYPSDFEGGTAGWSDDERFKYLRLCCSIWENGGWIDANAYILADIAGINRARNWREKVEKLLRKLVVTDLKVVFSETETTFVTQGRVCKELWKIAEKSRSATVGAYARWSKGDANASDAPMQTQCPPSPSLLDSKSSTSNTEDTKKHRSKAESVVSSSGDDPPPIPDFLLDVRRAFDEYNALAERTGLPIAEAYTEKRKRGIKASLKLVGGIDGWRVALDKLEHSAFCNGDNDRGWKASLKFLTQEDSIIQLMEGSYDHSSRKNGQHHSPEAFAEKQRRGREAVLRGLGIVGDNQQPATQHPDGDPDDDSPWPG